MPAFDLALRSDVRAYLTQVQVPTLVLHRREDAWFSTDHGRLLASKISGARYVELPGADHAPYVGTSSDLLGVIRWFVSDLSPSTVTGEHLREGDTGARLTPRQVQVLQLVEAGFTDSEIAYRMGLSSRTVQKHLELAYRRLGVRNRTAAVRFAHGRA